MKTWLLLDGNYLCWRAFHSTGDLTFEDVGTGVLFGFLRDIVTFTDRFATDDVVFCFDHRPLLRNKLYPAYKANRLNKPDMQETIDEVRRQTCLLRDEYLKGLGFNNVSYHPGYEADDMIAEVTRTESLKGDKFVVVGNDHDLYQLLRPGVVCWNPNDHSVMTDKSFQKEYGVTPQQWVTVKAMAGCRGDNVKGIPGVAEKTALNYLTGRMNKRTVTYHKIRKEWELGVIFDRNFPLVKLPFKGTPGFVRMEDEVTLAKWQKLTTKLGMKSLKNRPPNCCRK